MPNKEPAIILDGVSKEFSLPHEKQNSIKGVFINMFRGKRAVELQKVLKNISLTIEKGEFFGIVGKNGSGKSTLLKLLAGIYSPNKGAIRINGKLTPFIELGVGFNPNLTGRENVYLNGALLGFTRQEVNEMYDDIVQFAELEKFMDQKLINYSSGMQVRLAFSVAVRARSDILLLDEVLAVGDLSFQKKCYRYFEELKAQKRTVIFVSHDSSAVRRFCSRAALIQQGQLAMVGDPSDVIDAHEESFRGTRNNDSNVIERVEHAVSVDDTDITADENFIKLSITYTTDEDLSNDGIVFGAVLSNAASQNPVFWTNSQINKRPLTPPRKGKSKKISIKIENIFPAGDYYFELVLRSKDGEKTYCRISKTKEFEVLRNGSNSWLYQPKHTIKQL